MRSLGEKLKKLRMSRGLSQEELADKINEKFNVSINKGMISKWENNLVEPRLEIARILVQFFNVSLDELLDIREDTSVETVAAHHEGEDWSDEELKEIEEFKQFVKMKRKMRQQEE